jgi:hypothetical protein
MLDQSTLTGESVAVQIPEGKTAYVGTLVRGGEAIGEQSADRAMTSNGSEGHSFPGGPVGTSVRLPMSPPPAVTDDVTLSLLSEYRAGGLYRV